MAVTLEQIARRANVSRMTVSNVLSGAYAPVRPHAVQRARKIRQLAQAMGYRTNLAARSTRTGRHHAVSLVMSNRRERSVLPPALLEGLHEGCRLSQLHLVVSQIPDDQLVDETYIPRILGESLVDGLLINYNADIPPQMIQLIRRFNVTAVWINSQQPFNCIYPDDLDAAQQATRRLLEMGHRRITYLDFTHSILTPSRHYSAVERQQGYTQVLREAGLTPRRIGTVEMLTEKFALHRQLQNELRRADRPTAVLCYGPREARSVIVAALTVGLSVPEDLSVLMFADDGPYDEMGIHIDTMVLPQEAIGRQAVQMLEQRIRHPKTNLAPISVPFDFRPAQTLAPPRA